MEINGDSYIRGINNFCPIFDYGTLSRINDYLGTTNCEGCSETKCKNNGTCKGGITEPLNCDCPHGWSGLRCNLEITCAKNEYLGKTELACFSCPPGQISLSGSYGADSCTCPFNQSINPSNYQCGCPPATYEISTGECMDCPRHSVSPFGSKSIEACTECPPGTILNSDRSNCTLVSCPKTNSFNMTLNSTLEGSQITGSCLKGYSVFVNNLPTTSEPPLAECVLSEDGRTVFWSVITPCLPTCELVGCQGNGTCFLVDNLPLCSCPSDRFGKYCEKTGVLRCSQKVCQNGGKCVNPEDPNEPAYCDCNGTGFGGPLCRTDLSDCVVFPCKNGGSCNPETRRCSCDGTGFLGIRCEDEGNTCNRNPCLNGAKCVDTGINEIRCDCIAMFSGTFCSIDLRIIVALLAILIALGGAMFFQKHYYPDSNYLLIGTIALTLYDFITDVLFMNLQRTSSDGEGNKYFVLSLTFLVTPLLFNFLAMGYALLRWILKEEATSRWMQEHLALTAATSVLSMTNIEAFSLLRSNLFHFSMFQAPLSSEVTKRLMLLGLIGNVLEDIPQLGIQLAAAGNKLDTITFLSIVASCLSISFGFVKRALLFALVRFSNTKTRSELQHPFLELPDQE